MTNGVTAEELQRVMMTVAAANVKSGSFSNCTARYSGERDSPKLMMMLRKCFEMHFVHPNLRDGFILKFST